MFDFSFIRQPVRLAMFKTPGTFDARIHVFADNAAPREKTVQWAWTGGLSDLEFG
jgi:hypothetical protein